MASKDDRDIVMNVLDRTYPEYMWSYAITRLAEMYEDRGKLRPHLLNTLDYLVTEGLVTRKEITLEEITGGIERLIAAGRIREGELHVPSGPALPPVGYRLTENGRKEKVAYQHIPEEVQILAPQPA